MNSVTQFSVNNNDYDLKDSKAINKINYNGTSYTAENGVVNINDVEKSTRVRIVDLDKLPSNSVYNSIKETFENGFIDEDNLSTITNILEYFNIPISPNVIYFFKSGNLYNAVITNDDYNSNGNYNWLKFDIHLNIFKKCWVKEDTPINFASFEAFKEDEVFVPYNHKAIYFTSFNWFKNVFDNTTSKVSKNSIGGRVSFEINGTNITCDNNSFTKYIVYDSESHLLREPYIVLLQNNYLIKIPLTKEINEGKFILTNSNIKSVPYTVVNTPTNIQEEFARKLYYPIEG